MVFHQKIPFELILYPYKLRTIRNFEELKAVLALREHCFEAPIDKLNFDLKADHLVVEDMTKSIICGTYRLAHSDFCESFECEEDFYVDSLLKKPDTKIELAWACIHPAYRNGSILALLWRGISEIIKSTKAKYIFGITSVKDEPENILLIQQSLQSKELPFPVTPRNPHTKKFSTYELKDEVAPRSLRRLLPTLFRAYLMAGALVCTQPSYDEDLNCYDFMTVIEVDQLAESFSQHFHL